ncbi:hypothetical protein AVEN_169994-1, partial [Araneus ventricosus]
QRMKDKKQVCTKQPHRHSSSSALNGCLSSIQVRSCICSAGTDSAIEVDHV